MASNMKASILVRLLDQASGPANKIAAALRGIEKAGKRADRAFGPGNTAMQAQVRTAQRLGSGLGQTGSAVAALAAQERRLTVSTDMATKAMERQRRRTGRREARSAAGSSARRYRSSQAQAAEGGGASILAGGRGALGAVAGYVAVRSAIRATTGEAISFEAAMAQVRKKINDAPSPEAFGDLEKEIKQTSKDLGIPQGEVAALTAEAGASGVAFADLGRFIKLAAKASVGWDMAPQEAAQNLAEIKAGANLTIGEMETLSDKINALGDNSAAKERNIVEMFGRSAAAAKEAGVSFDTTLATLTAVNAAGMQPEIASRWFNSFAGGLRTASADNDDMVAGLKILGLTAKGVADGMKRDSGKTMLDVFDRLEKSPEAATAAIKVFGKGWWDETLRAKSAGAELRKQLDLLKTPSNFKGSLDKGLTIQMSTTETHLKRLSSLAADVGDRLGRWALPPINDRIERLLKQADELERRNKVREAGEGPQAKGDLMGRVVTKSMELGGQVYDKALDHFVAPLPTDDPSRRSAASWLEEDRDKRALAGKRRAEADILDTQSKKATKEDKPYLLKQVAALRQEAARAEEDAAIARRGAGAAGGRDMTDVEVGEAAAKRTIAMRKRMPEIEAALASGNQSNANVQMPGTSIVASREGLRQELELIRRELGAGKVETVSPVEPKPLASVMTPTPPARPPEFGTAPPAPNAPAPQPQDRPAGLDGRTTPAPAPVPDGAKIAEATAALATYKAELVSIESQLDGLKASGEAAFSPDLSGLESRKSELETLVTDAKAKLDALNSTTIAPKIDTSGVSAVAPAASEARSALDTLNGTFKPNVDAGAIIAALSAARQLNAELRLTPGLQSSAQAAVQNQSSRLALQGLVRGKQTSQTAIPS